MTSNADATNKNVAPQAAEAAEHLSAFFDDFCPAVRTVMSIRDKTLELLAAALVSGGHLLFEDVPGTGKTKLARTVATALGGEFRRIQCTPDLLPADITGTNVFNQSTQEFEFHAGPIFANVVLADEINRANPRTQAAFLEAMQEQQVTVDGTLHRLPSPFLVMATQNPLEYQGTFPLPEAQRDRFLLQLELGYPDRGESTTILDRFREEDPLTELQPIAEPAKILKLQERVRTIFVDRDVQDYIVELVEASRERPEVKLGASPRAMLLWQRAAQARAGLYGRSYAVPDDVAAVAAPLLRHRLLLTSQAELRGHSTDSVVEELLEAVPVPVETQD